MAGYKPRQPYKRNRRGQRVTYADKADMLALIWQTAKDGKAKDIDGDWGKFSVSRKEGTDGNEICVSFLLKD